MENNKSVTAVEWLVEQLCIEHRVTLIEKAKQIERQQIIDAANSENSVDINHGEQYYNNKFGK